MLSRRVGEQLEVVVVVVASRSGSSAAAIINKQQCDCSAAAPSAVLFPVLLPKQFLKGIV